MKLFTIGDSLSQGFMSGAAARTDLSYSTIISRELGVQDYHYPKWDKGGHPLNIEEVFRLLERRMGGAISTLEWPGAVNIINGFMDQVEDYYERGDGANPLDPKHYHNVAVRGFDVADAWMIHPNLCTEIINKSRNSRRDNWWGLVDESRLRTARTVLSGGSKGHHNFTSLDWLKHHHHNEGVENLIMWLGSNNALSTVLDLEIIQTSNNGTAFKDGPNSVDFYERRRRKWNLWHPDDFKVEYEFLMTEVVNIMKENPKKADYRIFVGTIPMVTIIPLIKAVGAQHERTKVMVKEWPMKGSPSAPMDIFDLPKMKEVEYSYAKYYTYFPFADNFKVTDNHLNFRQILHIDNCIRSYNRIIQEAVQKANKELNEPRIHIVDIATALSEMALKRNNWVPPYKFPTYFDFINPGVDTRYYGTRNGQITAGGIFSLDGVHPTAIGQGLVAFEFLKVMKSAGVYDKDPMKDMNWDQIFDSDQLYNAPIDLIKEIYENSNTAKWLINNINL